MKAQQQTVFFMKKLGEIPELAWQENLTSQFIQQQLGNNFVWSQKYALVYKLGKGTPIFFRAELDALNTSNGPKHVCGHAAHMAALMSAYLYLQKHPPKNKTIYFVFQPSEEGFPSGAQFISDHCKELLTCKAGFAFHTWPSKDTGKLFNSVMAACDYFEIEIIGKGTHIKNKNNWTNSDCIAIAGELAQKINKHKNKQTITNIGTISGGETSNAIAAYVKMTGDVRALTESTRVQAKNFLEKTVDSLRKKIKGCSIELHYYNGYPILKNDSNLLKKIKTFLPIIDHHASFGTEDFSLYPIPSVMLHIGTGKPEELHQLDFSVPDQVALKLLDYWITLANRLIL